MATILAVVPIDATEETFERDVIQRSFEQPVVVDFWAEWCGPCRSLGPVIEKAVDKRAGQVDLVKVDTDANPRLSQAFGIQSIPAVKAFKDGKVVDEFIGALPPVAGRALPRPHRALRGRRAGRRGRRVRTCAARSSSSPAAPTPRSRSRARWPPPATARARWRCWPTCPARSSPRASRRGCGSADDPELAAAFAALDAGETEAGLDALIEAIAAGDDERKDELRKVVVGVLDELGPAAPARARRAPQARHRPVLERAQGQHELADRRGRRRRLVGLEVVEGREPHAEQPHGLGGRVGAQQLERGLGDERGVVASRPASVRARVTVVQSARRTLIATVRPWRDLRCRPSQSSLRERAQDRLELLVGGDVLVEGALGGDRLRRRRPRSRRASRRGRSRAPSGSGRCGRRSGRRAGPRRPPGAGRRSRSRAPPGARRSSGRCRAAGASARWRSGCTPPRGPSRRSRRACRGPSSTWRSGGWARRRPRSGSRSASRTSSISSRSTRSGFSTPVRSA